MALVFGKLNGRPLYASAGNFIQYLFGAKVYVYHKEGKDFSEEQIQLPVPTEVAPKDLKETAIKIKELNYLLQQQKSEEGRLVDIIKSNRNQ